MANDAVRREGDPTTMAVVQLCHDLANATSLEGMFQSVVQALVATTGVSRAAVLTFDDAGCMRFRAAHGLSATYQRRVDGHSPWSHDSLDAKPVLVDDVQSHASTVGLRDALAAEQIGALAFLPLCSGGALLGKFMLYAERATDWSRQNLDFALAAADLLTTFLLRERSQDRLLQARKMESLGFLAGGIAHDFNSLLTSILGHVDQIRQETLRGTPARLFVDELMQTVEQAAEMTRQLLGFARPPSAPVEPVDLVAFVREAEPSLQRLCGANHRMRTLFACEAAPVRANRGQLHQLLMNLVTNARDAMPEGGTVSLALRCNAATAGVELEVSDVGVGMDEATRRRIFEPMFTTKLGRGTGLGLATCYAIVTGLGGDIVVRSAPERGSSFVVNLPQGAGQAEPAKAVAPAAGPPLATVLLVEDQDHVVRVVVRALQALHYRVLSATDGREALAIAAREPIDIVVSDVLMPGMTGVELIDRLRRDRPNLPVLLITGYVDGSYELPPGVPVLHKPFLPRELAYRVQSLLAAGAGGVAEA